MVMGFRQNVRIRIIRDDHRSELMFIKSSSNGVGDMCETEKWRGVYISDSVT